MSNNNNNNSKTTSRKVIITRKPSISEEQCSIKTTEENNNLHISLNGLTNKLPQQQMLFADNSLGMGNNVSRCYAGGTIIKTEIQQLQHHDQMTLLGSPPTKYRRFLSPPPPQLQDCNVFSQQGKSRTSFISMGKIVD